MKKVFWIIQAKSKSNPGNIIIKEIWTVGEHPEIARDKFLNSMNINHLDKMYFSEDIISITKLKEEDVEIGNPYSD